MMHCQGTVTTVEYGHKRVLKLLILWLNVLNTSKIERDVTTGKNSPIKHLVVAVGVTIKNSENRRQVLYFSKALFEGLIFGGAYVWREICISKSTGLACSGKEIYHFCFVLLCIWGQITCTSSPGAYIRRGDLTEGFLRYNFEGLIFGGAYTWRGLFSEFYGIRFRLL